MAIDPRQAIWIRISRALPREVQCPHDSWMMRFDATEDPECVLCREGDARHAHARCDHCGRRYCFADGRRVA